MTSRNPYLPMFQGSDFLPTFLDVLPVGLCLMEDNISRDKARNCSVKTLEVF